MMPGSDLRTLLAAGVIGLAPIAAGAHAALLSAETVDAIALYARYDTGEAMMQAQVIIYSPADPTTVWSRGTTDDDGRYLFVPDPDVAGRWTIQVRQAGHGAMVHVETAGEAGDAVVSGPQEQSTLQRLVMVGLVVWGALGTALYFRRGRGVRDASA